MLLELPTSHDATLQRAMSWGVEFDTFFDVGAAKGNFGYKVRSVYPTAEIVFFEAAPYWRPALEETRKRLGGRTRLEMAAAGERNGELHFRFDEANPMGGALVDKPGPGTRPVPVVSLDDYAARQNIDGKVAIKLDVHGAEQMILRGANKLMARCQLLIFETYNFGPEHRRFGQMAVYLEEQFGMRCFSIAEPKWRPYDNALWQMDFYFARFHGTKLSEWRLN